MTVSLPSEWTKQNNINPGDIVFVIPEKDSTLKIVPSQLLQKEEAEEYIINADVCNEPRILERIIIGSYILGRDVIRVVSSRRIRKEHVDEVRGIIRKLIGLGILEETPKSILLQCAIDPAKFKFDLLFRRLSLIASTILSEAMQALAERNNSLAGEAINREDEADTIYYLAVRLLLSAQMNPDIAEKTGMEEVLGRRAIPATRLMLQNLESIADHSEGIAKKVIMLEDYRDRLSADFVRKICHLGELTQTIFDKAVDCVFTKDIKISNGLLEMRKAFETESEELMRELPEIPYLRAIVSTLSDITDKAATFAHLAMNMALEEPSEYLENIVRARKHVRTLPLPSKKKT